MKCDASSNESIRREAEMLLSLSKHPNIISCSHVEVIGDRICIFFDYFEFKTFKNTNLLSLEEILACLIEIAEANEFIINKCNIVHRDLALDNIFLADTKKYPHGKIIIIDFGESQFCDDINFHAGRFTYSYGSPERKNKNFLPNISNIKQDKIYSEVFSFGLIACQLFTGIIPEEGQFVIESLKDTVEDSLSNNLAIRNDIIYVLTKCCEEYSSRRYKSFQDIIQELQAIYERLYKKPHISKGIDLSKTLRELNNDAISLYNIGKEDYAIMNLKKILESHATNQLEVNYNYMLLIRKKGNIDHLIMEDRLQQITTFNEQIYDYGNYLLSICKIDRGNLISASINLKKIKCFQSFSSSYYHIAGLIKLGMFQVRESIKDFENAWTQDKNNSNWIFLFSSLVAITKDTSIQNCQGCLQQLVSLAKHDNAWFDFSFVDDIDLLVEKIKRMGIRSFETQFLGKDRSKITNIFLPKNYGYFLAACSDGSISIRKVNDCLRDRKKIRTNCARSICLSHDDKYLFAACSDGSIIRGLNPLDNLDLRENFKKVEVCPSNIAVTSICLSHDDKYLFAACSDGSIIRGLNPLDNLDLRENFKKVEVCPSNIAVTSICLSHDDKYLFAACSDGSIIRGLNPLDNLDLRENFKKVEVCPSNIAVTSICLSHDDKYLFAACSDGSIIQRMTVNLSFNITTINIENIISICIPPDDRVPSRSQ